MAVKQIVVGSDARDFAATLVRSSDGAPINPTSARLQGKSKQLRASPIDVTLVVGSGPTANVCSYAEFGNLVTAAMLASRSFALYTFRVKYVTGSPGKADYSPEFQYEWVAGPV